MPPPKIPGYRVVGLAGAGGFADVYQARDASGRLVALKIAHADNSLAVRRLWYEAIALRAVGPPIVPALYDDGSSSDSIYLAMEWLAAPSLFVRLEELNAPMSLAEFAIIARAVLKAVTGLHNCGFVHRDLKPDHLILDRSAGRLTVRLLDLGLVVPIHAPEPHRVRAPGRALGTSTYMAPEQVAARPITRRADIYALGVVMYEMLTGAVPFDGNSSEIRDAHLAAAPPIFERLARSEPIARIVARCLRKDPAERYASAASLQGALTRALAAAGVR